MTGPCLNCADRHQACHGSCEKYKAWKEQHDQEIADLAERKRQKEIADAVQYLGLYKRRRRRKKSQ